MFRKVIAEGLGLYTTRKLSLVSLLTLMGLLLNSASASIISLPYVFTDGQPLPALKLNTNNQTIYNDYNGGITNANLASGAAIVLTKLAPGLGLNLVAAGNPTWAAGVTGDVQPRVVLYPEGIKFGPGGAAVVDLLLKRVDANTFAFRDAGDTVNKNLNVGAVVGSSLTLTTPLAVASGGLGTGTIGSAGQIVRVNSGATAMEFVNPATVSAPGVGGSGADGALTSSGIIALGAGVYNVRNFNATTFVVDSSPSGLTRLRINTTGTVTFLPTTSTVTLSAGMPQSNDVGGASSPGSNGYGLGPGTRATGASDGGGGGGGSTAAGAGSFQYAGTGGGALATQGQPGRSYFAGLEPGSSGGSGHAGAGGSNGSGGSGGGTLLINSAGAITLGTAGVSFSVSGGNGLNGAAGVSGAGGGGGAGVIALYSLVSITSGGGTLAAAGGNGGNGFGAGGDGGGGGNGGTIIMMSPSNGAVTTSVVVGTGGTGTVAGTNGLGAGSVVSITGTPTNPTIAYHCDGRGLGAQVQLANARKWLNGQEIGKVELEGREHISFLAAWYTKPGQFDELRYAMMHGGGTESAKLAAVDVMHAFDEAGVVESAPVVHSAPTAIGDLDALADRT